MERRSPPTERVVRILTLFAQHPQEPFGLSEVARRLDIGKATCLAILNELVEARFLVRDAETREHALGPAALTLGLAAQEGFTTLRAAKAHLEQLSAHLDLACTASALSDDAHVVLARSGPQVDDDPTVRVGQRFPFAPPWGTANVAWDPDDAVEAWLAKPPIVPVAIDREHHLHVVADARRRGYLVEESTDLGLRVNATLAHYADAPDPAVDLIMQVASSLGYRHYLLDDISDDRVYDITMVAAPTFDAAGRQELLIALYGFPRQLAGRDLRDHVETLLATTRAITDEVGGHDPWR